MGEVTYTMFAKWGEIITYAYEGEDFGFSTHLLSEVGAPYQQWFFNEIVRRGWIVERGVTLEREPWCADVLLRKAEKGQGNVDASY